MKLLKPIIVNTLLLLFLVFLNNNETYAYTESDCSISEVNIQEANQVLGYNDILHMSCRITSNYQIKKVQFWIRTTSKNIGFDMEYDINSGKYIKNLVLDNSLLETTYSTFLVDVWYNKNGKECKQTTYADTHFAIQNFVFNNNCKNNIHVIVIDSAIPATIDETGLTEGSHCSVCGKVIKTQQTIPILSSKEQKITIKKDNYTYKAKSLKNKKATITLNATALGKCKLTYRLSKHPKNAKAYISINKSGKVTLKKGIKKGTYKILITAAASNGYNKATKTVTIKVK